MEALFIDFGFFFKPAGFDISHAPIAFAATDSFARAFAVGLLNTLIMAGFAGLGALALGIFIGIGSHVGNRIGRAALDTFIGLMRNLPKLLILLAVYVILIDSLPRPREPWMIMPGVYLSNRGLNLPGFDFATLALELPAVGRFGVLLQQSI